MISGDVFGRLTLVSPLRKHGREYWLCRCECGRTKEVARRHLTAGKVLSCRCLQKERAGDSARTHGLSLTPTHIVWKGMIARCRNPHHPSWARYGGRGISVCERWASFECFLADMGPRPAGKALDRIDNAGNYEPGNCRWATLVEQGGNKRNNVKLTLAGESIHMSEAARRVGLKPTTVSARLRRGDSASEALRPVPEYWPERGP